MRGPADQEPAAERDRREGPALGRDAERAGRAEPARRRAVDPHDAVAADQRGEAAEDGAEGERGDDRVADDGDRQPLGDAGRRRDGRGRGRAAGKAQRLRRQGEDHGQQRGELAGGQGEQVAGDGHEAHADRHDAGDGSGADDDEGIVDRGEAGVVQRAASTSGTIAAAISASGTMRADRPGGDVDWVRASMGSACERWGWRRRVTRRDRDG